MKLRNMTGIYLSCNGQMLLLYRQGGRVVTNQWVASAGGHFEQEELNDPKTVPALLTFAGVGLILLLLHGITLVSVKGMILCMVLMWASISDIAKHEVPDFISAAVLILAFVGFEPANLPSMIVGAAVLFIPQLAVSMLRPARAIGGADMKLSAALGFLLGAENQQL